MIDVNGVSLIIKNSKLLDNVSLKLEEGTITGLVGNNGSGKTVLMKCICGFMKPTSGQIMVDDKQVGKEVDHPVSTGIILENPGFVMFETGFQNLKQLANLKGEIGSDVIRDTMQKCGLDPKLKLPVRKYSLGMRQRLGIAQAIMENQKNLILDEPMNGLDKNGVEDMRKLFAWLKKQGKIILMASHNKEDIDILCDNVYEISSGVLTKIR